MKRIYSILLLFSLFSIKGKSQSYIPLVVDSTHWFTTPNVMMPSPPPYEYFEYYLLGDTLVSSMSYKKVYYRTEWSNNDYGNMTSSFSLYALLREDTTNKKVYAIPIQNFGNNCQLNQEVLLYDFDKQVGDTLKASNLCLLFNDKEITNINQGNTWLSSKAYQLQNMPEEFYEGVGSYFGLFEIIELSVSGPQPYLIDYCRGGMSNCVNFSLSINENNDTNNIDVFPNPILDYFIISSEDSFEFNYQIISIAGRTIEIGRSSTNTKILNSLSKGIYLITINGINKDFKIIRKLIKYH